MNECRDAKGNLLKVGDRVKCISNKGLNILGAPILNKIYRIFSFRNAFPDNIIITDTEGYDGWYSTRFVKVDCLKNKIRKLKRLIKK